MLAVPIRVVFFDLGDTLVKLRTEIFENVAWDIARMRGKAFDKFDARKIVSELREADRLEWLASTKEELQHVKNDHLEYEYLRIHYASVLQRLDVVCQQDQLVNYLASKTTDPSSFKLFDEVPHTLSMLSRQEIGLGLISNAFPSAKRILQHFEELSEIKYKILSFEEPEPKPAISIYKRALTFANIQPTEAMFVDDRIPFVEGALNAEMNALLIDRNNISNGWQGNKIKDLMEVCKLATNSCLVNPQSSYVKYSAALI
jgi:FMN phosphatase YigB (HAD superfamily)